MSNDKVAATFHGGVERVDTAALRARYEYIVPGPVAGRDVLGLCDEVDRLTASVEVISERLRHGDPNRPGSFEDACNHALLHVEATLSGKSRPLALERQKVARLAATLDRVRALADEAQDQYAEGDDDGMLGFNQIYAALDTTAPADPDERCGWYLGEGWQEACTCPRPKGHDGPHTCEHSKADPDERAGDRR